MSHSHVKSETKPDLAFENRSLISPYETAGKHVIAFYAILQEATLNHFDNPNDPGLQERMHALVSLQDTYLNKIDAQRRAKAGNIFDKKQREGLNQIITEFDSHLISYLNYYKLCPPSLSAKEYLKRLNGLSAWKQPKPDSVLTQTGNLEKEGRLIKRIDQIIYDLTEQQKKELRVGLTSDKPSSYWASTLSSIELTHLRKVYEDNSGKKTAPPPSLYRRTPGLANYLMHTYVIEKIIHGHTQQYKRHSAVSGLLYPFDLKDDNEAIRLGVLNLQQLIETAFKERAQSYIEKRNIQAEKTIHLPLLLQTLVSPFIIAGVGDDDQKMVKLKECIIKAYLKQNPNPSINVNGVNVNISFRSTNRPLNQHRIYGHNFDSNNKNTARAFQKDMQQVIASFRQMNTNSKDYGEAKVHLEKINSLLGNVKSSFFKFFQSDLNRFKKLNKKVSALIQTQWFESLSSEQRADLHMLLSTWNAYIKVINRSNILGSENLLIAGLEDILADKLGGLSYGSCKSGKDRKGVQTIMADSLVRYFSEKSIMPISYNDPQLMAIFKEEFLSNHRTVIAEMNAPGAFGLKSLKGILPEPFYNALKKEPGFLETQKFNSSLNKPHIDNAQVSSQAHKAFFESANHEARALYTSNLISGANNSSILNRKQMPSKALEETLSEQQSSTDIEEHNSFHPK